jgi:UDP-glucose 4-epimerase
MQDAILVTGGAGYIGSHAAHRLLEDGGRVVVADNLSAGHRQVVELLSCVYGPDRFAFEPVDLVDGGAVEKLFRDHTVSGIIDFAARCLVGESQELPRAYFDANVIGFRNLLRASGGIPIVKSSTCATYGNPAPEDLPLTEDYPVRRLARGPFDDSQLMPAAVSFTDLLTWYQADVAEAWPEMELDDVDVERLKFPTNVYGLTKLLDELMLSKGSDRVYLAFRYFNVAGAHPGGLIGEHHDSETHLIPLVLAAAAGLRPGVTIYGDDYATADGTAVRDYVHVQDLVEAHVRGLDYLLQGGSSGACNLGTSEGASVREIIEAATRVTGKAVSVTMGSRRSGDPDRLVADPTHARNLLGWTATRDLESTIASAWRWHRLNPAGYRTVQEERYNPFWGRWINIAAHRASRPWHGEQHAMDSAGDAVYEPTCYLCPGNVRTSGERNPRYDGVWQFPNDFPSLMSDAYETDERMGPYAARTSRGDCEVIVYGPDHVKRLSTMSADEVCAVVDAWTETYRRLGDRADIDYVLIFENRGTVMGNSQPHPHAQVYAYGEIPDLMVVPQIASAERYRAEKDGACFVCDANQSEIEDGRRLLVRNASFVGYVPFAAQFPYDVVVAPVDHAASLLDLTPAGRADLATVLRELLAGLDELFGAPYHYSLALIQAPTDKVGRPFHMQVHITSLLRGAGLRKHVVGADIFGRIINPSDPNHTAAEIRYAIDRAGRSQEGAEGGLQA